MGLDQGTVLQVVLPLYGILEAGTHWFKTYHDHYTAKLGIVPSTFDPCLLFNEKATAIISIQTNDTLIAANTEFMAKEEYELQKAKLRARPYEQLSTDHPLEFNGFVVNQSDDKIQILQHDQIDKIKLLSTDTFTKN